MCKREVRSHSCRPCRGPSPLDLCHLCHVSPPLSSCFHRASCLGPIRRLSSRRSSSPNPTSRWERKNWSQKAVETLSRQPFGRTASSCLGCLGCLQRAKPHRPNSSLGLGSLCARLKRSLTPKNMPSLGRLRGILCALPSSL